MTNQVFGPYSSTLWSQGVTPLNASNMNNIESQAGIALHGFGPDVLNTGFVYSGCTCTKDGVTANQLDIAAGRAYVLLSDSTFGLIVVGADNTHVTSTPSTTYYLYLQPDGTFYWSTTNAPATHSLGICQVTTDASGNILTVTDTRSLNNILFPNMLGNLGLPNLRSVGSFLAAGSGSPGVGVIVAQALSVHVTATTLTTILTYSPAASGYYRINAFASIGNGTPIQPITVSVTFTDADSTTSRTDNMSTSTFGQQVVAGADAALNADGTTTLGNGGVAFHSMLIHAASSASIVCKYRDAGGTPNDYATFIIERLA